MSRGAIRVGGGLLWGVPLLLAFGSGSTDDPGAPPPTTHIVEIEAMEFRPAEVRVRPGDTIIWINRDVVPHTATASDSSWTSPTLGRDERWSMVAPPPDAGRYVCVFHPVMEARLIVEPTAPPSE